MQKKIAVIGVGSAGIISAGAMLASLDNSWEITSIYDPSKEILGIGESTNANFCNVLEQSTDFSIADDLDKLDATYKFGTKFIKWRDEDWINPLIQGSVAVHFNTFKLKEFALPRFEKKWGNKYKTINGKVTGITQNNDTAIVNVDGTEYFFDYVIDCRGFPGELDESYVKSNCSLINHGIVHDSKTLNPVQATEHIATNHGWMFGVPLQSRTSYGYLYNDIITTKDEAIADMSNILNVPVDELTHREYSFTPYYKKEILDRRILKNGNQAFFLEPISATSIFMYIEICNTFLKFLKGNYNTLDVNQSTRNMFEDLETVISYYYHGGSSYDTEFWNQSQKRATETLTSSWRFHYLSTTLNDNVVGGKLYDFKGLVFPALSWYKMDKFFRYNYFTGNDKFNFNLQAVTEQYMEREETRMSEIQQYVKDTTQKDFNDVGYVHVKNVVNKSIVDLVSEYALNDQLQNFSPELEGQQIPGTHSVYADPLMEALLKMMHPVMESVTGLTLYPTYSYYRVYKPGDELVKHRDRESCEISTTICFNFDYKELTGKYDWPIWMIDKAVVMEPGDMVAYHGCDLTHWREPFNVPEGSWHVQAFLHYVDANGPHAEFKYDRRQSLGTRPLDLPNSNVVKSVSHSKKSYITYTG